MVDDSDNDNDTSSPGHVTPLPPAQSAATTPPTTATDAAPDSRPPCAYSGSPQASATITAATEASTKATTLDSQPMTATSSASSAPSIKITSANDANGPSPYGTRSRNKTGTARINYAEDRDMDVDADWGSTSKKAQSASSSAALTSTQAGESEKFLGVSTRRSSTSTNGSAAPKSAVQAAPMPKDYIPGMSTFSVNADTSATSHAPSKKRKAPGGVPNATTGSTAQVHPTSTRRTSAAIPAAGGSRETNMLSFESSQGFLKNGKLRADDGTLLGLNDHVYLICEPPGEPYYVARIMEFLHAKNDHGLPIDSLRVNWYYRPRDIQRKVNDTRVVFASMHSDTCPLTSLRGKCRILHRSDISDLDEYRKTKDNFWYEKMYDRYIHRYYEVIPTAQVINVPERVKRVLDERWKFVIVEIGRGKELTSAVKSCKRCSGYCASNDSVDCAMCKNTYHMNCVRPALLKKPARGFAWSCGPCSRKQERKLEARNTPIVGERAVDAEEEELLEEEEDDNAGVSDLTSGSSPMEGESQDIGTRPATAEQIAQAKLWPYRYLGIHCRVEDALDYDDRIYPRASSRLGPRHQANVTTWHGRPVELAKPADIKKKYIKGSSHKKDAKLSKETIAALEADKIAREKRPKWVVDEPPGYVHRGEDHPNSDPAGTARLLFHLPDVGELSSRGVDDEQGAGDMELDLAQREKFIDDYMTRARPIAKTFGLEEYSTNFLDKALELLCSNKYAVEPALEQLRNVDKRKDLKEPELNKEELRKFEEGVAKYGSELRDVSRHVGKSQKHANIVRFYYMWKKTDRGKQIWGHYEGRKGKKQAKQTDSKLVDDVADDVDDSAFDNDKAALRKRGFECKFCATRKSPQWRRAPGTVPGTAIPAEPNAKNSKDKGVHLLVALCQRCAGLWRKYGIQWENIDEVAKKVAQGGGRAWKRRVDEELLIELVSANEANQIEMSSAAAAAAASVGLDVPPALTFQAGQENAKKKQKINIEQQQVPPNALPVDPPKKKVAEKPPEPPLIPEQPRIKALPCAVCYDTEPASDQLVCCRHCRLTVHRNCYGIAESRPALKWLCDMCFNDHTGSLSSSYECVLCPVRWTEHELMEPPRISHKKKTDREREKERLEREMVLDATEVYRRKQDDSGKPLGPREPLKRTAGNNWVHVVCAIWTTEMIFGDAKALSPSEGIGSIPTWKYQQVCKLCKTTSGACVTCHQCPTTFHVACAQQHGYILGFDVRPIKGSRRDVNNTIELGNEAGNAKAVIYCKDHTPKDIVHPMNEPVAIPNCNALQSYVRTYKQADTSMSGTVRKATLINSNTRAITQPASSTSASGALASNGLSGANSASGASNRSSRVSPAAVTVKSEEVDEDGDRVVHLSAATSAEPSDKECTSCGTTTSPKWHKTKAKPIVRAISHSADKAMVSPSIPSQPHLVQPNGYVNGDVPHEPERSSDQAPVSQSEAVVDSNARSNGASLGHETSLRNAAPTNVVLATSTGGPPVSTADAPTVYQCHRCYMKHLRDPPSHRTTPSPPQGPRVEPDVVHISDSPSPSHGWPPALTASVAPPATAQSPYNGWPSQPLPSQHPGPIRMTNGVSHSPPPSIIAPPVQHHYAVAPPPPQYHVNGYGHPPQAHTFQQHQQVGGGPTPYQLQRNTPGLHGPANYSSPRQQQYGGGQHAQYVPQPSNASHSPQMHHQTSYVQHGPTRAADNPYSSSYHTQTSPRPPYSGGHGSPQGLRDRPETPTEGIGRPTGWSVNEGQMANGASASPSLRNLLS